VSSQLVIPCAVVIPCAKYDVNKVGCIWNEYRAALQPDNMSHHALHKLWQQLLQLLLRAAHKEFVPEWQQQEKQQRQRLTC
jgi:urease accessory protein UreF